MRSIRIGKTLKIHWAILTGGAPEPLEGRDLRLEISSGNRFRMQVPFAADSNVAEFEFQGADQRYVGAYAVTMWENRGKENQTVVDRCDAFCLVACSCEETSEDTAETNLDVETLELESSNLEAGVPGMSAYELFKRHNPDSELTEEGYAAVPVQAAGAALAAVEAVGETEAKVKQAEHTREQAEQGREEAERNRASVERQRAQAEQMRVTDESIRQMAETGRQAAETKREENAVEAVRNCEDASRNAEDEAARVRTLADNPPKIVEVEGVKYWAFWDEVSQQYIASENRTDVGDALLFSPQHLTMPQQAQALSNAGLPTFIIAYDELGGKRVLTADEHALLLSSVLLKVLGTPFGDMCLVYGGHISSSRYRRYTAAMDNMSVLWVEYDIERRVFNPFLQRYFRDLTAITTTRQTWNASQQTQARENISSVGYLQLAATLGTEAENWPLVLTSPLAEVQAAYTQFWAAPGRYRWSLTINSRIEGNPFVEEAELEPLHRDDGGLELLFTCKRSRKRYALVLTVADGAVTSVGVEYRMRPGQELYLAAGAAFNEKTGYWEYCDLRDITDEQIAYAHSVWIKGYILDKAYYNDKRLRFTFPCVAHPYVENGSTGYAFYEANDLEMAIVPTPTRAIIGFVYGCRKLKAIYGANAPNTEEDVIDIGPVAGNFALSAFNYCYSLTFVKLKNIKVNIDLQWSANLRTECVEYMIANAANTQAITLTLHPEVYAHLSDELKTAAAAKNIALAAA